MYFKINIMKCIITECPEGYTSAKSLEDGELCYPTSALLNSADDYGSVFANGNGGIACPPGKLRPNFSLLYLAMLISSMETLFDYVSSDHSQ